MKIKLKDHILLLKFPTRLNNVLLREEINTIKDIIELSEYDLYELPNIGEKFLNCIRLNLRRVGLSLKVGNF